MHLNNHHRDTLRKIVGHPMSHNVDWRAVLSLLEAVGSVEENHEGRFLITLGPETEMFERPKGKDASTQQIVDLRRMLGNAGYESPGDGPGSDDSDTEEVSAEP
jgi:hypothetical protein